MKGLFFNLFTILTFTSVALAGMKGPPIHKPLNSNPNEQPIQSIGIGAIRFFQVVISPLDGPKSPSYPTGSAYGLQAVKQHGLILGSILTADRLFHEADQPLGPMINLYGKDRYFDPLQANLYWWDDADF